ncbi:hypothetical protein [Aquimarina sp. AU474]|uniref:hypothetical protein n=1 Tax=Aquimarina sp. AU474 TaxID=2108529 RepID=UPI000D68CC2D|nr:hypothetical protein [Aquimarina sp. AU474]
MALENLINTVFSDKELSQLTQHIKTIKEVLSGKTYDLSNEQRKQYGHIANKNKLMVNKAKNYMEQYPEWIPQSIDKEEFDRDHETCQQIDIHIKTLQNITQQLIDTKMLLDYENYSNALSFYRSIVYLLNKNEPGAETAYLDMKELLDKKETLTTDTKE